MSVKSTIIYIYGIYNKVSHNKFKKYEGIGHKIMYKSVKIVKSRFYHTCRHAF